MKKMNLKNFNDEKWWQEQGETRKILIARTGSHAYGTNIATSDIDERGVFIAPRESLVLPFAYAKKEQISYDGDKVYFELSKYMTMLLSQNPNVLEILWAEPQDILFSNHYGDVLMSHKDKFLSKRVGQTYAGYAEQQLQRIRGHKKWINNPQKKEEPQRIQFLSMVWNNTPQKELNKTVPTKEGYVAMAIGAHHYGLWAHPESESWLDIRGQPNPKEQAWMKDQGILGKQPDVIVKVNENAFQDSHNNWKNYWEWKNKRNESRSALEEKFGYDTKHAMHLVRLLRSGLEILQEGKVLVKRPDASDLLDIRAGKYSYDEIIKISDNIMEKIKTATSKTALPEEPDTQLAADIMLSFYNENYDFSSTDQDKNKNLKANLKIK